jgi:hypothetical protein
MASPLIVIRLPTASGKNCWLNVDAPGAESNRRHHDFQPCEHGLDENSEDFLQGTLPAIALRPFRAAKQIDV